MKRIHEIYTKMDESQKAKVEPQPNFPPPPPPSPPSGASKMIQTLPPPPPPPSANATAEQKKAYLKALEEIKNPEQTYTYEHKNDDGELIGIVVITDIDNFTKRSTSALYHITEMIKKGANFFYNEKAISGEQAMKYIKTTKELYIWTKQMDTNQPKVYISTEPISYKE